MKISEKIPISRDAWKIYRRLFGYVRPYRKMFALGVLGGALFAGANTSVILFVKYFWENAFPSDASSSIGGTVTADLPLIGNLLHTDGPLPLIVGPIGIILLFSMRSLGDFMQTYWMGYVGRRVVQDLRTQGFDHCMHLPITFFDRNSTGDLLSRLTYNTELVAQATTDSSVIAVREFLTIIGALSIAFWMSPQLTGLALIAAPIVGWLSTIISRLFRRYSQRIQQSMGDVTRVAKETLEAPRVIKVFNAHGYQSAQFKQVAERNRRSNMKLIFTRSLSNPIVQFLGSIGLAAVIYVAAREAQHNALSSSTFTAVIVALVQAMQPLRNLISVSGPLQQGITAGHSIFELLDQPVEPSTGTRVVERAKGAIEFRDISFDYQAGKGPALHGVNLRVAAGESVAIVGRSGSGKSTLVSLVPRFYDVDRGAVIIDGFDAREYELTNLRSQISLVSQEVVLFNDSIRNNIAFGSAAAGEAVEEAARAAHVLEFTQGLPQGLDTEVGDRGVLLSGGQRQRIAIARALLRNTPILILDEATSALDTESERAIQSALDKLMQNRTTLVIAHRLSTVEKADRIVVMDGGRIVEVGTHAELLAMNGAYAALYRMQFNE